MFVFYFPNFTINNHEATLKLKVVNIKTQPHLVWDLRHSIVRHQFIFGLVRYVSTCYVGYVRSHSVDNVLDPTFVLYAHRKVTLTVRSSLTPVLNFLSVDVTVFEFQNDTDVTVSSETFLNS